MPAEGAAARDADARPEPGTGGGKTPPRPPGPTTRAGGGGHSPSWPRSTPYQFCTRHWKM